MIKHIIFDLDGTLLDTLADLTRAISDTLRAYNLPPVTEQTVRGYLGGGAKAFVKMALKEKANDPVFFDQFFADYLTRYKTYQLHDTKPYPGIIDLLETLKQAGKKLYVFSNKPHDFCLELVEARLPGYFNGVHGHVLNTPPKPDPTMFLTFADHHHIHIDEAIYIGDSHFDYAFGKNVLMKTILVGYGYEDEASLLHLNPDGYVASSKDLLAYLMTCFNN